MDVERWRRLDALFQGALDRRKSERRAFLDEHCADDPGLRKEVEAMLAADEADSGAGLEPSSASAAQDPSPKSGSGSMSRSRPKPASKSKPTSASPTATTLTATSPELGATVRFGSVKPGRPPADRLAGIVLSGVDGALLETAHDLEARPPGQRVEKVPFASLGPYRLIKELGRGGLATVYLAERDDEEFSMEVAVKLVRRGLDSPELLERLRLERQILARLEHPNIARLIDGGTTPDGRPYFVMERIEGERIDDWCLNHKLDLEARIALFLQVCDAVQTAHHRLVLHRDIKPSNILVAAGGVPKLLDFGIAKLLDDSDDENATVAPGFTTLTDTGARLLTPEFASPEQVRGETLTTASDVYSLGVLLYLMITGERPYTFDRGRPAEIERVVCEVEPPRPSSVVWSRSEGAEELPSRRLLGWPRRAGGDDLDTIVREALRKEPELRYDSVARLSSDLRAYLLDLPISARPDTLSYLAGKFVRRHRGPVAAVVLLLLVLIGGVVTTSWQAQVARRAQQQAEEQRELADEQRDRAELQRRRAEEATTFLIDLFDISDPFRDEGERQEATARELLDRGADRIANRLGDDPLLRATLMTTIGRVYRNMQLLDESDELLGEALDLRRSALGEEADEVLDSLQELADLRLDQERYQEAEEILEQVVAERRRRDDSVALALSLEHLARAKRSLDLTADAETLLKQALEIHMAGGDELAIAQTRSLLGQLSRRLSDHETAERMFRDVLEVRQRELNEDHPLVTLTLNDLALTLQDSGQLEIAEQLFRQVLETYRRTLGERNHHVITATLNLASVLIYQRKTEEALRLHGENEARAVELYGPSHPVVARIHYSQGLAHQVAGQPARAIPPIRRAWRINSEYFGPEHTLALRAANQLSELMVTTGDPEAESVLRELLAIMRQVLGPRDHRLAYPLLQLGNLIAKGSDPREAEAFLREAVTIRRAVLPPGSWEIAFAEASLGFSLLRLGKLDEAAALLEPSSKILRDRLGEGHGKVRTVEGYLEQLARASSCPHPGQDQAENSPKFHQRLR